MRTHEVDGNSKRKQHEDDFHVEFIHYLVIYLNVARIVSVRLWTVCWCLHSSKYIIQRSAASRTMRTEQNVATVLFGWEHTCKTSKGEIRNRQKLIYLSLKSYIRLKMTILPKVYRRARLHHILDTSCACFFSGWSCYLVWWPQKPIASSNFRLVVTRRTQSL